MYKTYELWDKPQKTYNVWHECADCGFVPDGYPKESYLRGESFDIFTPRPTGSVVVPEIVSIKDLQRWLNAPVWQLPVEDMPDKDSLTDKK